MEEQKNKTHGPKWGGMGSVCVCVVCVELRREGERFWGEKVLLRVALQEIEGGSGKKGRRGEQGEGCFCLLTTEGVCR